MENIVKPKEKEPFNETRDMFGMVRNNKDLDFVEASLTSKASEMTKQLLNYKRQVAVTKDKAITQTRCLTRLL